MPAPQSHLDLYVSPLGRDNWSGRLAEANADDTDGPFATVTKARDTIRELKRATKLPASVTVWLRGGRYILKAPLTFTHADSAPVTYAAFPGETPVLDGGTRITGWQKESPNGKEVWVTTIPEVAEGKWYFRQLFVNGARRSRPRLPKEGFYRVADYERPHAEGPWGDIFMGADAFQCTPGHVQSWKNITDIDIVVIHWWVEERVSMAGFDPATNTVKLANKTGFTLKDDVADGLARYYVENVKEALSDPGEWYLDRSTGKLTYVPMPGEDIETAQVFVRRLRKLVQVTGDADAENYVEFLRFEGLTFEHAEWDYCLSNQAAHKTPAVITFEAARSCAFENCTVRHIGGYAVELRDGCQNIRVVGNTLVDLGAGGVHLNGADAIGPRARRTVNNRITDNVIGEGGRVFLAAVGVLSRHSFGNHISHNHIYDLYYSGVSCGWVWGYHENVSQNNRIEKNHIHDIGHGILSDMGGIYTLGVQPGTMLRGNLIHDIEKSNYGGWAIYMDEGSSHIISENNICYNTSSQGFHQHYGRENVVRNNIFAFGREGQATVSRYEDHLSVTFDRNIFIGDNQPIFAMGRPEQRIFLSNNNLFWDVARAPWCGASTRNEKGEWGYKQEYSFEEWRKLGYDPQSIVADPKCRDFAARDFTLEPASPAFALGFEPIDMSDVGPRPPDRRE